MKTEEINFETLTANDITPEVAGKIVDFISDGHKLMAEEIERLRADNRKISGSLQLLYEAKKWEERYGRDQTYLLIVDKAWKQAEGYVTPEKDGGEE